jgi:hypothetical protein
MGLSAGVLIITLFGTVAPVFAQINLVEPVYRVANDTAGAQTSPAAINAAVAPASNAPTQVVLDFTQRPGEHPLAPLNRVLKSSFESMDESLRDYSCTFIKQERIDGELGEAQHIFMKVRHEPFSVYMSFLKPFTGREVLWVDGQNNNEMVVREAGFKRMLGKMNLDPNGAVAMRGQKYPITRVGVRNLTGELLRQFESDARYQECEVAHKADMKIGGRETTMVQVTHPIPRQNFRAHVARLFFDNELRILIHYDAFGWPAQPGAQPPLEERFTYTNLKINNGYTARDFDANNNPEIFKP